MVYPQGNTKEKKKEMIQALFVVFLCGLGLFTLSVEPVDILPWYVGIIGSVVFISTILVAVVADAVARKAGGS